MIAALPRGGKTAPKGPIKLDRWFAPAVSRRLSRLVAALDTVKDPDDHAFLQACLSVAIQRTSLADPLISVPVRLNPERPGLTEGQRTERRRWLQDRRTADPFAVFEATFRVNVARMDRLANIVAPGAKATLFNDARDVALTEAVDLVITSPPYGSAQKYVRSASLSLQWLDLIPRGLREIERRTIGREHFDLSELSESMPAALSAAGPLISRIRKRNPLRAHIAERFLLEMAEALSQARNALRPGGALILVVGDNVVCGEPFPTSRLLSAICLDLGLDLELELVDKIKSRGLMTRRNSTAGLIADEWIGIFRRPVVWTRKR